MSARGGREDANRSRRLHISAACHPERAGRVLCRGLASDVRERRLAASQSAERRLALNRARGLRSPVDPEMCLPDASLGIYELGLIDEIS